MKIILKLRRDLKLKKPMLLLLLLSLVLSGCGPAAAPGEGDEGMKVVATVFPAYDFARAAAGDLAEVTLLLPPGAESHSYEPTPADILAVQDCDLFIYLGGESDAWVDTILASVDRRGATLRMIDCVELMEEETVEGMEEAPGHGHEEDGHGLGEVREIDEHVWTAPRNAAAITRAIGGELAALDGENAAVYETRSEAYAAEIQELDRAFRDLFDTVDNKTIVFGDRFPLRYFAEEYDLAYYAAFPGCSTQTEPSAATIAFLMEKVKGEGLSTVFYIEFSNHLVADSIAEATGTQTALFHTCHNVSGPEMAAGATYVSLMEGNLETLRAAMG